MVDEERIETEDNGNDDQEERERVRDMLAVCDGIKDSLKSIFPPEFFEHLSNAGKENLLAVRSLIDNALEKIDREIARAEQRKTSR